MVGTDNLKKAALVGIKLQKDFVLSYEDRKINFMEAMNLVNDVASVLDVAQNSKTLGEEWKDLDGTEKDKLKSDIKEELELKSDDVEELIVTGLDWVDVSIRFGAIAKKVFTPAA